MQIGCPSHDISKNVEFQVIFSLRPRAHTPLRHCPISPPCPNTYSSVTYNAFLGVRLDLPFFRDVNGREKTTCKELQGMYSLQVIRPLFFFCEILRLTKLELQDGSVLKVAKPMPLWILLISRTAELFTLYQSWNRLSGILSFHKTIKLKL
jgi:hypothetical protein